MRFPLRLTPFEEYMFMDDRPAYPMMIFCRLRFSGRLDASALEGAIQETLARHPLIRCKISRIGRKWRWEPDAHFLPVLERFVPENGRDYPEAVWMDPSARSCTRGWLIERKGTHDLFFQLHHSVTDGIGGFELIEDLLVFYARRAGLAPETLKPRPLDAGRLAARNRFGVTRRHVREILPPLSVLTGRVTRFLKKHPTSLAPGPAPKEILTTPARGFPFAQTYPFSVSETRQLLMSAREWGCTLNDLLARDLIMAVGDLRRREGWETPEDLLRFAVPVNLRKPGDERLSASNLVSMVFLFHTPAELADPDRLLRSVQEQTRFIKQNRLPMAFVLSLAVGRLIPGSLRRKLQKDHCQATAVFSNLGTVLADTPLPRRQGMIALGDLQLEGLDLIGPLRPRTALNCCVCTYADRLFVTIHHDGYALTTAQATDLLTGYVERIRRSAVAPAAPSTKAPPKDAPL